MSLLMTVKLCRSPSAEAEALQLGVVPLGAVPPIVEVLPIVEERSFGEEQWQPVAVVMSLGDIVTRAINIAAVAAPTLQVFIVAVRSQLAVRSQEVALLPAAELLGARVSPTAVADGADNR